MLTTDYSETTRTTTIREVVADLGLNLSAGQLSAIGQTAAALCRERGIPLVKRYDGRWTANAIPIGIIEELLPAIRAIAAAGPRATGGQLPDGSSWRVHRPFRVG